MDVFINSIALLVSIFLWLCGVALIFAAIKGAKNKKLKFSKPTLSLILGAIIAGAVITGLYTAQMDWIKDNNCTYSSVEGAGGYVQTPLNETCFNLAYGYPKKFISARTDVAVSKQTPTNLNLKDIEPVSQVELDAGALTTDLVLWSLVSLAVMYALYIWIKSDKPAKKRRK